MEQKRYKTQDKGKEKKHIDLHLTSQDFSARCSFCGAELDEDDMCCTECGGPRAGLTCPTCGSLCHGSFCHKCNTPLDDLAREAIRKAKEDPHFRKAEQLAARLAALETLIPQIPKTISQADEEASEQPKTLDTTPNLSNEDREALKRYSTLFGGNENLKVIVPTPKSTEKKSKEHSVSSSFSINPDVISNAVAEYKRIAKQLQAELEAMLPEPTATPEEQRNFFSARKITATKWKAIRQSWVCNYCGCHHRMPSECAKPWMGGHWTMKEARAGEITTTIYD